MQWTTYTKGERKELNGEGGRGTGDGGHERDGVYLIFGKEAIVEIFVIVESVDHVA